MLYPQTNRFRTVINLDGIWRFKTVKNDFVPESKLENATLMSVPSSYNDISVSRELKDYVGKVCYEQELSIPDNLSDFLAHLYIGSAAHQTTVYFNYQEITKHVGGFLPMDVLLEKRIIGNNILHIVVDNRLYLDTLPMGEIIHKEGHDKQLIHYDFYNYSGIHRSVLLYFTKKSFIKDIFISTHQNKLTYSIASDNNVLIEIIDKNDHVIAKTEGLSGIIEIKEPIYWNVGASYLYRMKVVSLTDEYTLKFGLRDIEVKDDGIYINNQKIYLKGFGKHEDFYLSGKGNNNSVNLRDFELMKWINANSFRTSHYPYAEEIYDLADEYGILVINEVPAVGFNFWSDRLVFGNNQVNEKRLINHLNAVKELINRDKFHPSVVMLCLGNEANTFEDNALSYYEQLVQKTREWTELPLINVEWVNADINKVAHLFDVIGINRYIGWYTDFSDRSVIMETLSNSIESYHQKFNKPILITEFGADTIAGFHQLPSEPFSEEFQIDFIKEYQNVFRKYPFVIGEHIWNFADFMTKPGLTRFGGNKKGVFTRERQPKMISHYLRDVWGEGSK